MLEYLAYKKYKKNKAEKEGKAQLDTEPQGNASSPPTTPKSGRHSIKRSSTSAASTALARPLIDDDEQRFLERLTSSSPSLPHDEREEGLRPPLPPRVKTPDLTWDSDSESFRRIVEAAEGKQSARDKGKAVANRVSLFIRTKAAAVGSSKDKKSPDDASSKLAVPDPDVDREKDDLTRVLDDLNLAARNNKAFALSADSNELVRRFTLVLKDLVNGVPTAVNDLTSLLEDRDGTLAKNYEKLPSSMKKLVTQLPEKLSSTLAPELLAVAAEAQGLASNDPAAAAGAAAAGGVGLKGAAKKLLVPKNLKEMITKPGAVVSMLKGIMNALKLRWPAFIGTNVIWSLALFLLLFVLWYCHKRGKEVRLDKEKADKESGEEGERRSGSGERRRSKRKSGERRSGDRRSGDRRSGDGRSGDRRSPDRVGVVDGSSRITELPDDPPALPGPAGYRGESTTATPVVIEPSSPREEGSRRRRSHRHSGSGSERHRRSRE